MNFDDMISSQQAISIIKRDHVPVSHKLAYSPLRFYPGTQGLLSTNTFLQRKSKTDIEVGYRSELPVLDNSSQALSS